MDAARSMTMDTAARREADVKPAAAKAAPKPRAIPYSANPKGWWLRQLRTWHWISSAVCLVGLVLFTITGITLNHAGQIEAEPRITSAEAQLPDNLIAALAEGPEQGAAPLPEPVADWVSAELDIRTGNVAGEWDEFEIYLAFPRPGGDAWLSIDRETGAAEYEATSRGAVAWLNDLHKGRNTGAAWRWFIDIFAVACLAFAFTGLALLYLYAKGRRMTWPLVGAGLAIPLLLALFFIH
jgi:hypothetical protein